MPASTKELVHFTKYRGDRKEKSWVEVREVHLTSEGRPYIWWLKQKLPVTKVSGDFCATIYACKSFEKVQAKGDSNPANFGKIEAKYG